ncbi:MAG: tRNA (adenosine(37)-N6)-threonylcarbamoyltransferase complex ATPase subunit type 1 TsaE [Candidatus Moranbacteria bacterium]|nr:tRNA (adenosine(37)-N6)-threonylcarbamoyltransferase complex ATPase subunit type 1 TsaE [Candidatus Moranbacteria bacterium]
MISEQQTMNNPDIFVTNSSRQTQKMGELLATELHSREIICLTGDLGSGKTTFAQGVLKGLGAKGPYTSPTFVVMKQYKRKATSQNSKLESVYHIDAYRVGPKDVLDLGWEEIIVGENNVVIIEWAERVKAIIPKSAVWIKFEHLKEDERKIII